MIPLFYELCYIESLFMQMTKMKLQDKRTKQTNEILNGMKVLKLYAWEIAFSERLLDVRDEELSKILRISYYISGTVISLTCAPIMVCI